MKLIIRVVRPDLVDAIRRGLGRWIICDGQRDVS